ncbi:MAG: hypothetical protein EWM47_10515 [Anaerolineaceae bacterium]|nr:MAG: hypothetical protein EWM47_10515 [Anaerolineaceae bacterium]
MNTSYEDKMYRQIEKSLSNNINDKLFVPIEMVDKPVYGESDDKDAANKAIDEYKEAGPRLSRAEYILQAREACLRQMNTLDTRARMSDSYVGDESSIYSSHGRKKRGKVERLFNEGAEEENLPEEIASFRSLIIRTVCAAVIFLSIFIIDKVKVDWGVFSYESVRQYVTGNNQLKVLEEIIVSMLK